MFSRFAISVAPSPSALSYGSCLFLAQMRSTGMSAFAPLLGLCRTWR